MIANKQVMNNNIKFVIIIVCAKILSAAANAWVVCDGKGPCKGPGQPGVNIEDCIPIRNCTWMVDFIKLSQPLSDNTQKFLKSFHCGFEGNTIKVRCTKNPLLQVASKEPILEVTPDITNHQNVNLLSQDCGVTDGVDRIYGGSKTNPLEFPWMAMLSYRIGSTTNYTEYQCGGTIINDRYILTAAHCITNLGNKELIAVRLGEHNIDTQEDCVQIDPNERICAPPVQDIRVEEVIPHPKYNPNTFINDIGLVRLAWPINLAAENAQPICLPVTNKLKTIDILAHDFTVTGWGITGKTGQSSPELLRADIPAVSETNCRKAYERTKVVIDSNHICAGSKTSDPCRGDSGGPLEKIDFYNNDIRHIQYGIVSFGPQFCGDTSVPGVYTRVDRYLKWILDNLKS